MQPFHTPERTSRSSDVELTCGAGEAVRKRARGEPTVVERDDRRVSATVLGKPGKASQEPMVGARQAKRQDRAGYQPRRWSNTYAGAGAWSRRGGPVRGKPRIKPGASSRCDGAITQMPPPGGFSPKHALRKLEFTTDSTAGGRTKRTGITGRYLGCVQAFPRHGCLPGSRRAATRRTGSGSRHVMAWLAVPLRSN